MLNISNNTPTGNHSYSNYLKKIEHIIHLNLSILPENENDDDDDHVAMVLDQILDDNDNDNVDDNDDEIKNDEEITAALDEILSK